ncbi:MAG: Uma2 family endonuclease [Armatimonadetes bacterium]|nr:Uma2 family endonuclease [Anaerolineae bacterium]
MTYDSHWVTGSRVPDIILVPALTVEVVSGRYTPSALDAKAQRYLADGVRMVWVIDPAKRQVTVYHGEQTSILSGDDTLLGSDVIPGFEVPLTRLFGAA